MFDLCDLTGRVASHGLLSVSGRQCLRALERMCLAQAATLDGDIGAILNSFVAFSEKKHGGPDARY